MRKTWSTPARSTGLPRLADATTVTPPVTTAPRQGLYQLQRYSGGLAITLGLLSVGLGGILLITL